MAWHFTVEHPISGYAYHGHSIVSVHHPDYERAVEKLYTHLKRNRSVGPYLKDVDLEEFKDEMMSDGESLFHKGVIIHSVPQEDVAIL